MNNIRQVVLPTDERAAGGTTVDGDGVGGVGGEGGRAGGWATGTDGDNGDGVGPMLITRRTGRNRLEQKSPKCIRTRGGINPSVV